MNNNLLPGMSRRGMFVLVAFIGFTNCGNGAQALKETYQKGTGLN